MSYYPVWYPRSRISADRLFKGQTQVILKQQDTFRTTNTFQLDPELQVDLEGGGVYWVEFYLRASAISTTAAIRTNWSNPAGSTGLKECQGADQGVTLLAPAGANPGGGGTPRMGVHQFTTNVGYGFRAPNNAYYYSLIERGLITMGSGPGTLALNWAQIASDAADTAIRAGSMLTVRRLA